MGPGPCVGHVSTSQSASALPAAGVGKRDKPCILFLTTDCISCHSNCTTTSTQALISCMRYCIFILVWYKSEMGEIFEVVERWGVAELYTVCGSA